MTLVRWQPRKEFGSFDRLFDRFFEGSVPAMSGEKAWTPAVDVAESDEGFRFSVEVPGFDKEDLDISLENSLLTITGERKFEKEEGLNYRRVERFYGRLHRAFQLPDTVNPDSVQASLKNGVLTVSIARREETKPKQISVTVQ